MKLAIAIVGLLAAASIAAPAQATCSALDTDCMHREEAEALRSLEISNMEQRILDLEIRQRAMEARRKAIYDEATALAERLWNEEARKPR